MEENIKKLEDDAVRYRKIAAFIDSDLPREDKAFAVKALLFGIAADVDGFVVNFYIDDLRVLRDESDTPIGFAGPGDSAYLLEEAGRTWRPL